MLSQNSKGFTLIEILIVVAIIGIITIIAFPSYQENILKAKRTDGRAALMKIMQAQERFFAENMTYSADLTDLGYNTSGSIPSEQGYYTVSAVACASSTIGNCVLLTATGDLSIGSNITLDSVGNKLPADQWR